MTAITEIIFLFSAILICNITEAVYYCNVADPCAEANASTFFEPYARFEICQYDSKYGLCDRYINPNWYRVDDAILTQCPQLLSCGALYPVWLNGSLPTEAQGIVDVKACKVGFSSCCSRSYDVKIRNCGSFYAYCLGALDSCSERYCFGKQGSCEVPTTVGTTTTPAPTTAAPPITCSEDPCIESNLQSLPQPKDRSMQCEYKTEYSYCDNHLSQGWYKHDSPMLTKCPSLLGCGAIYPVWLNGTIPSTSDGVVTRKACQKGYDNCCSTSYDIKIKNCGEYTAYCLKGLNTCPSRYCFGDGVCWDGDAEKPDADEDRDHSHVNLEIILGAILGVLTLIFAVMLIINRKALNIKKCCKRESKLGSTVNIQKSEKIAIENPTYCGSPPPSYSP